MRSLSETESAVLALLFQKADLQFDGTLFAESMNDGDMGSIRLSSGGGETHKRAFGRCAAELEFIDEDGAIVLVSLNLDAEERPFELDVWRTDFRPVINLSLALNAVRGTDS